MCCLLIHKPADVTLKDENLEAAYIINGDGIGMSYVDDGKLIVQKGYWKLKDFLKDYRKLEKKEMMIHFRRASPGMIINIQSCHPFRFTSKQNPNFEFSLGHNGRINIVCEGNKSDTETFARLVLFPILDADPYFLDKPAGEFLVEQFLGKFNKIMLFRYDKEKNKLDTIIVNGKEGTKAHGCWFSNYSYIPIEKVSYSGGMGGFGGHSFGDELAFEGGGHLYSRWNPLTREMEDYEVWSKREKEEAKRQGREESAELKRLNAIADRHAMMIKKLEENRQKLLEEAKDTPESVAKDEGIIKKGDVDLSHLAPDDQRRLKSAAAEYFLEARKCGNVAQTGKWSIWEMISYMRSDMREKYHMKDDLSIPALDKYIVNLAANNPDELSFHAQDKAGNKQEEEAGAL